MEILKKTTETLRRITTEYWAEDYKALIRHTFIEDISESFMILEPETYKLIAVIDYSMLNKTWHVNGIYVADNRTEYNFIRFYRVVMSVYDNIK